MMTSKEFDGLKEGTIVEVGLERGGRPTDFIRRLMLLEGSKKSYSDARAFRCMVLLDTSGNYPMNMIDIWTFSRNSAWKVVSL